MSLHLTEAEARVLGCLIEKEMSTPEYYPLSLNALVNACNQKSNRDPVVSYDEALVASAFEGLRVKRLAVVMTGGDNRVPKYLHRIGETINLGNRELAVLCVLLLRGPQTPGELKSRTERMHAFDDLEAVDAALTHLTEWSPEPLATKLARVPGERESRYAHLLHDRSRAPDAVGARPPPAAAPVEPVAPQSAGSVARLEAEVAALRADLDDLKRRFADFRKQFE